MKIAFFVDAFPDLSVTFIINQIVGLLARGHHVDVYAQAPGRWTAEHPDVKDWDLAGRTTYVGPDPSTWGRVAHLGRELLRHPLRAPRYLRTLPPFRRDPEARAFRHFSAAAALGSSRRYDVVHCHFGPNGNTAVALDEIGLLEGPVVTTFHGYDMRRGVESEGRCYEPLRRGGALYLSISRYNMDLLRRWGFDPDRIREHRVGIDPEQFPYRGPRMRDDGSIRLLSVANLVPVKGHQHSLEALASLRSDRPDLELRLRIVGDGRERLHLEETIRRLGLEDHVTLVGALDRLGVIRELQAADLFVLPSLAEATPVALMEAQSIGLPVIATRVGAVDEVVAEDVSGRIVEPGDSGALASAIESLATEPGCWESMGRAGREHVLRNFDIEVLVSRLEDFYREVARPSPTPSRR